MIFCFQQYLLYNLRGWSKWGIWLCEYFVLSGVCCQLAYRRWRDIILRFYIIIKIRSHRIDILFTIAHIINLIKYKKPAFLYKYLLNQYGYWNNVLFKSSQFDLIGYDRHYSNFIYFVIIHTMIWLPSVIEI